MELIKPHHFILCNKDISTVVHSQICAMADDYITKFTMSEMPRTRQQLPTIVRVRICTVDKQTFDLTDFHFLKEHSSACKIVL